MSNGISLTLFNLIECVKPRKVTKWSMHLGNDLSHTIGQCMIWTSMPRFELFKIGTLFVALGLLVGTNHVTLGCMNLLKKEKNLI